MEKTNIQAILIDLNAFYWMKFNYEYKKEKETYRKANKPFDLIHIEGIIDICMASVFTHISQGSKNKIAIYRYDEVESEKVFPLNDIDNAYIEMMSFGKIKSIVTERIINYIVGKEFNEKPFSRIIEALGKGLCFINKQKYNREKHLQNVEFTGKILLIYNSEIPKSKFKELMSCVFVCQSRNFIIDALILNSKRHDFLLQATAKTKGLYFPCNKPTRGAMQYFMQVFNISADQRENFKMPYLTKTPYNASCECHNERVDLAWICSRCLGIYCQKGKQ